MRVVLDTNVVVSGMLWTGPPNRLLRWARDGVLDVICCEKAIAEVKRVVEYPRFHQRMAALDLSPPQAIAYLMNLLVHVPSPEAIPAVIAQDPSDDLFLALAVENQARLIVSGDRHLLALEEYERLPVVTPGEAVDVVRALLA
jgi:uncharacterized protein